VSIFKKTLIWLSWANHRHELTRGRRYLVCDSFGHVAASIWSGADFILDLGGFDQALVRTLARDAAAACASNALLSIGKKKLSASEGEQVAAAIEDRFEELLQDLAPDFACPMWFMETPPPPGPDAEEATDVPAAVHDHTMGLLARIEQVVIEHEAQRYSGGGDKA
jgi:hypothetical protein